MDEPRVGVPPVDLDPATAERIGRRTRRAFVRAHAAARAGAWRGWEQWWIHHAEPPAATLAAVGFAVWAAVAAAG